MNKKIFILIPIFCSFLFSATYNYPGSPTSGTITWAPGDIINITASTTFTNANIVGQGTVANPLRIYIASGANASIDTNSSLQLSGIGGNNVIISVLGGAGIHNSFIIQSSSRARFSGVEIRNASYGISIEGSNDVVIDSCYINRPDTYGVFSNNASPRITRTKFLGSPARTIFSVLFTYTSSTPARMPEVYANELIKGTRVGNNGHIGLTMPSNPAAPLTFYFEANYFDSTPAYYKYPFLTNILTDDLPRLSISSYTGTNLNSTYIIDAGVGNNINGNFHMYENDNYSIANGNLNIVNGASLHLGVSRNNIAATTYTGNSTLRFNGAYSLNILNGATIRSEGTTTAPNYINSAAGGTIPGIWGKIDLTTGSTGYFDNTYISNATTALDIQTAALTLTNVTINYNNTGTNSNTNISVINNYFGNNATAMRITGGTPTVQGNRMTGNTTAFNISGGTLAVGQIQNNRITGATTFVTSSTGTSGAPVYFERNYWGVPNPATPNFSGTGTIDYEPWYIDTSLTTTRELAPTATAFIPVDGSNIAVAPARLTFNIWEIGYHNGNVPYDLEIANNPAFTAPYAFSGNKICNSTIFHDISGTLPAGNGFWIPNTEYFWRIRTDSPADTIVMPPWSESIPSASFILQGPQVDLVLTSDRTFASAGQQVLYTVDFTNNSDPSLGASLSAVRIVNVLPDDVFFDGQIQLSSINPSMSMGNIVFSFYSDAAGTALIATKTYTTDTIDNTPLAAAAQNRNVRRIDVVISTLPDSTSGGDQNHGIFRYRTIVK